MAQVGTTVPGDEIVVTIAGLMPTLTKIGAAVDV
jgi:hypothetical protein